MSKKFQKKVEDFICEKCGKEVKGNGFTNHCPECLWGKHVDVNPGDRLSECKGLMEPVRIEKNGQVSRVIHKCLKCGFERANEVSQGDNFDVVLKIAENYAKKETSQQK